MRIALNAVRVHGGYGYSAERDVERNRHRRQFGDRRGDQWSRSCTPPGSSARHRWAICPPTTASRCGGCTSKAATILVDTLADRLPDGARVVLVGSRTATGVPGKSPCAATKAALPALARSWAAEPADRGITVNVIAPGPTETPMLSDPGRARTPPAHPPLGRYDSPDEVAGLTAFLLGPDGGAITGQQLVQCAGASL
ncbi:hypothetical protein SALBM311S_04245 [Streptomyces alboniger]